MTISIQTDEQRTAATAEIVKLESAAQAAKNRHEQERVLWDLWDAANVWPGADDSTMEVIRHIAKTLGISLQVDA